MPSITGGATTAAPAAAAAPHPLASANPFGNHAPATSAAISGAAHNATPPAVASFVAAPGYSAAAAPVNQLGTHAPQTSAALSNAAHTNDARFWEWTKDTASDLKRGTAKALKATPRVVGKIVAVSAIISAAAIGLTAMLSRRAEVRAQRADMQEAAIANGLQQQIMENKARLAVLSGQMGVNNNFSGDMVSRVERGGSRAPAVKEDGSVNQPTPFMS